MVHQPARFYTLVETEKEASEFVFNFLKENNYEPYLNPDEKTTNLYTIFSDNSIIVKDLIFDVFCEPLLFSAQQGSELENIFIGVYDKYAINIKKAERYANRRNKKDQIVKYMKELDIYD